MLLQNQFGKSQKLQWLKNKKKTKLICQSVNIYVLRVKLIPNNNNNNMVIRYLFQQFPTGWGMRWRNVDFPGIILGWKQFVKMAYKLNYGCT